VIIRDAKSGVGEQVILQDGWPHAKSYRRTDRDGFLWDVTYYKSGAPNSVTRYEGARTAKYIIKFHPNGVPDMALKRGRDKRKWLLLRWDENGQLLKQAVVGDEIFTVTPPPLGR
jgi:hypothetical protein